jgi:hypothetical protein
VLWIAFLTLAAVLNAPALTDQETSNLLSEANALFRQANELSITNEAAARDLYQRAALRYERIAREGGVRNGKLFYNIGNAWFLCGDVGRAILNYRRAQEYISGDPNLEQNLNYARSTRLDSFEDTQQAIVLKTLLFWHYDISSGTRSVLFAILGGLFWIAAAVRLVRPGWIPGSALIVMGVLAALFLGSLVAESVSGAGQDNGVIVAQQVTARKGDGESYEPSFQEPLHAGTEFRLLQSREDWYQVELPDGRQCWIPSHAAGVVGRL